VDLWGGRADKYDWLDDHHTENTKWKKLTPDAPDFYFVPKDFSSRREYEKCWSLVDIFPVSNNGLKTDRDDLFFDFEKMSLDTRMRLFFRPELPSFFAEQYRVKDSSSYDIEARRKELSFDAKAIRKCLYRPFDFRWLYYDIGLTSRPAEKVMKHLLAGDNLGLCCLRQSRRGETGAYLAVNCLVNKDAVSLFDIGTVFPLYLYANGSLPEADLFAHDNGRRPNLSAEFIKDVCEKLQAKFVPDGLGRPSRREFGPEFIFQYAYAVFHSPTYRERYAEFLRADFPRLPLTGNFELFRTLGGLGAELVGLHARGQGEPKGISFPIKDGNVIEEVRYQPSQGKEPGRVWVNKLQYVEGVPESAWTFPIGGYRPAQRWLKDRIGRTLAFAEQEEYKRIIWALMETKRLMGEIDSTICDHGGWPLI
jgi:predicted helicase